MLTLLGETNINNSPGAGGAGGTAPPAVPEITGPPPTPCPRRVGKSQARPKENATDGFPKVRWQFKEEPELCKLIMEGQSDPAKKAAARMALENPKSVAKMEEAYNDPDERREVIRSMLEEM